MLPRRHLLGNGGGNGMGAFVLTGEFLRYLKANAFISAGDEDGSSIRGGFVVVWQMLGIGADRL
jgi:hypothetical protein